MVMLGDKVTADPQHEYHEPPVDHRLKTAGLNAYQINIAENNYNQKLKPRLQVQIPNNLFMSLAIFSFQKEAGWILLSSSFCCKITHKPHKEASALI